MTRSLIAALLLAASAACSGGATVPAPCEANAAENEYAVYSAAVEEFGAGRGGSPVFIFSRTEDVSDPTSATGGWVGRCEEFIPETEKSMAASYRERNRRPLDLARAFTLGGDYVLVSEEDLKAMPDEAMRLKGLRARYPGASGVISLSRPGFNPEMTRAVVYISHGACGLGCGEGACMLLEREGCRWRVKNKGRIWTS